MLDPLEIFFEGLDSTIAEFDTESGPVAVRGFFDNAFFDAATGETVLRTTQPRFICPAAPVNSVERGTPCTIAGEGWTVVEKQPDGTGCTTLLLHPD